MIEPVLADDAFIADVQRVWDRNETLDLWWLGQSGFLLQFRGCWVLIDPYLSDSLTKKYAATDKPHVRMTRRVVAPERLDFVNVVTSSHHHTDHLDGDTLRAVLGARGGYDVIVPQAHLNLAVQRLRSSTTDCPCRLIGLDADNPKAAAALRNSRRYPLNIDAVPAAHETVERDENGHCKYLGYVFSFAGQQRPDGRSKNWTVYHSGDTVLYDGIAEKLRRFNIDVALLPINGRAPERRVAGNLDGKEAAWLAKEIGAKLVIPCHYDMFEFNTADPQEQFIPECERLGQPYKVLRAGERWSSQ